MRRLLSGVVLALALCACNQEEYKAQSIALNSMNDSMNYAMAFATGYDLRVNLMGADTTAEAMTEFVEALNRGFDQQAADPNSPETIGLRTGQSAREWQQKGLSGNPLWALDEAMFYRGLVNGILGLDSLGMSTAEAYEYASRAYAASQALARPEKAAKAIPAECPKAPKAVRLSDFSDSINYAYGYLNGQSLQRYVLSADPESDDFRQFVSGVNRGRKTEARNFRMVQYGEVLGRQIRGQYPKLLGEPTLDTDFELIRQGFVNGLMNYRDMMEPDIAVIYVESTLQQIHQQVTAE